MQVPAVREDRPVLVECETIGQKYCTKVANLVTECTLGVEEVMSVGSWRSSR